MYQYLAFEMSQKIREPTVICPKQNSQTDLKRDRQTDREIALNPHWKFQWIMKSAYITYKQAVAYSHIHWGVERNSRASMNGN